MCARIAYVRGSDEFFVRLISFSLITVRLPCIAFRYVALSSLLTANLLPPHFIHWQPSAPRLSTNRRTVCEAHSVCAFGLFHAFWLGKITNEIRKRFVFNGAAAFFPFRARIPGRWVEGVESLDITCETFRVKNRKNDFNHIDGVKLLHLVRTGWCTRYVIVRPHHLEIYEPFSTNSVFPFMAIIIYYYVN